MDLSSDTHNQHFLSQVEQRLNAANPEADSNRQRIFSFRVYDRESYDIRLEKKRGCLISRNLSLNDLFTFDVDPEAKTRFNYEVLFQQFEGKIAGTTQTLLQKLAVGDFDLIGELYSLFTAKLLNFARNPYSVTKILNTFGVLANYQPVSPEASRMFHRVLNGRKPHQARLCAHLGISNADYECWLRMLFMLFIETGTGERTLLESIVKSLFESRRNSIAVLICTYGTARCLLSDRSFSQITDHQDRIGFEFNLQSDAFIRFLFAEHSGLVPGAPPELIKQYETVKHPVQVRHLVDNYECLRGFNRNTVYQCFNNVFCSVRKEILF